MRWKVRLWNTDLHMCAPWYMHSHAPSHTYTCTKQTLKTLNDKAWLERTKPTWPLALPVLICESLCPLSTDAHTCALESGMFKVLLSWAKASLCSIKVFALRPLTNLLMSHGHLLTRRQWEGLRKCSITLRQPVQTELKSDPLPQSPLATRNPWLGSPRCCLHIAKALTLHMLISPEPYSDPVQSGRDRGLSGSWDAGSPCSWGEGDTLEYLARASFWGPYVQS